MRDEPEFRIPDGWVPAPLVPVPRWQWWLIKLKVNHWPPLRGAWQDEDERTWHKAFPGMPPPKRTRWPKRLLD